MSWWDAKGLTSLATQALKTAQKRIDKVLDIKEEDEYQQDVYTDDMGQVVSMPSDAKVTPKSSSETPGEKKSAEEDSFFSSWLSPSSALRNSSSSERLQPMPETQKSADSTVVQRSGSLQNASSAESPESLDTGQVKALKVSPARQQSGIAKPKLPSRIVSSSDSNVAEWISTMPSGAEFQSETLQTSSNKPDYVKDVVGSGSNSVLTSDVDSLNACSAAPDADKLILTNCDSSFSRDHSNISIATVTDISTTDEGNIDEDNSAGWNDSQMWSSASLDTSVQPVDASMSSSGTVTKSNDSSCSDLLRIASVSSISSRPSAEDSRTQLTCATDVQLSVRDSSSLEGSLEASADELSEGNKTVIADGSDTHHDDTDVDESRLDSSLTASGSHTIDDENEASRVADSCFDEQFVSDEKHVQQEIVSSDTMTAVVTDQELGEKSTESMSPRSTVSTGSYVKNLLDEAMAETVRDGTTSSDPVRNESGGNSGHTSADEVDTTTSSDIEIISHTSASGLTASGLGYRQFDVSPSRQHANVGGWVGRTTSSAAGGSSLHRRTDSGSSAQSLQSRTEEDFISPDGSNSAHGDFPYRHSRETRRQSARCDAELSGSAFDVEKLLKKLAEMAEILDAREKKQLELSHENMDLVESNNDLRSRLHQMEQAEAEERKAIREEFQRKLGEMEKKVQAVTREKDSLKNLLHEAEVEIARRSENIVSEKLLKEKEQIIAELMEEGEKLSKKQLQQSNAIKKLRSKEKESDGIIATQKQKIDEQKAEIERLEHILDTKVETEKKHVDMINQLNVVVKAQEEEVNRLKSDLEDAQEKYRSVKVALDNSYKEISELHKARVTHQSEAHKAALDVEIAAKEQLTAALDECRLQMKQEQMALCTQIEDLQLSLSRMEKDHGRREDILRQEISDLQQRLQDAEERNQELTRSVSGATRPLLRQIENLQSTYAAQSSSYERVEKNLTDRLGEAHTQLASAVEKERFASEKLMEMNIRVSSLESQISSLRQERSRLMAELDVERSKVELADEAKNNETAQKEAMQQKYELELGELKKDKVLLENHLEMEKTKVETGKKKIAMLHDQIREKEILLQMTSVNPSPTPPSLSREDSVRSEMATSAHGSFSQGIVNDRLLLLTSSVMSPNSRTSLYDSVRQSGNATSLIESLQSELKQREGEIMQLQNEIVELERTRESMARELVSLSIRNEDLTEKMKHFDALQGKYMELDQRYNALLQMYGEKVEEMQELRLDLQDVKEMYKTQIDELLKGKSQAKLM